MIIVAGGDSFVWGSELQDSPNGSPTGYSRITFPALLSGDNYICAAYPGFGNRAITKNIIEYCSDINPDAVIVCWTWPSRDNELHSDSSIIQLQKFLKTRNIPYLFTCADNCVITGKLDYSNWFLFPPAPTKETWNTQQPRGFYQWAVENKYPVGQESHPLEQAHQAAANLIQEKFNELVTKSIQ